MWEEKIKDEYLNDDERGVVHGCTRGRYGIWFEYRKKEERITKITDAVENKTTKSG